MDERDHHDWNKVDSETDQVQHESGRHIIGIRVVEAHFQGFLFPVDENMRVLVGTVLRCYEVYH